ncbi:hypothetical protein D3C71_1351660 [compost metagenome]
MLQGGLVDRIVFSHQDRQAQRRQGGDFGAGHYWLLAAHRRKYAGGNVLHTGNDLYGVRGGRFARGAGQHVMAGPVQNIEIAVVQHVQQNFVMRTHRQGSGRRDRLRAPALEPEADVLGELVVGAADENADIAQVGRAHGLPWHDLEWQFQRKAAAQPEFAGDAYLAAHQLGQARANGQADASASYRVRAAVDLIEGDEELSLLLFADADARIYDLKHEVRLVRQNLCHRQAYDHMPRVAELDGIAQ